MEKRFSPMMEEYLKTKKEYSDSILFYRLGDFYEMFFEDAELVSKELDLVLTSKACGDNEKAPMCGIPFHSAENYILKLVNNGHKVAIAEQLESPSSKRGLMQRQVIRVITPGTLVDSNIDDYKDNNYILSIFLVPVHNEIDIAWCDFSTGDFYSETFSDNLKEDKLVEVIERISPSEILTNFDIKEFSKLKFYSKRNDKVLFSDLSKKSAFKNSSEILLWYLNYTQKQEVTHLEPIRYINDNSFMRLDRATLRNLEITETLIDKKVYGSLFGILDLCKTSMGSRKLKQWITEPLFDCEKINKRLNSVECLYNNKISRNNIRVFLRSVYDMERLITRISLGTANARDLLALKQSISVLSDIKNELSDFDDDYLKELDLSIDSLSDIYDMIEKAIIEEPSGTIRDGNLIKDGYSEELDELKSSIKDSKNWLKNLEENEKERTGIKNLKVKFNKIFGYYIEVNNSQLSLVPDNYIRRQTLVGCERFYTTELKEQENKVLNAQNSINELEYKIFISIRDTIKSKTGIIQETANALSVVDLLCSFAEVSEKNNYVKPIINNKDVIDIKNGRHPVIEKTMSTDFVPNNILIDRNKRSLLLITGPNMAGKSTYMRQLALIVLLAQSGCFVPADYAQIGICDRIFTRIGSSDNISTGESTFYVEMSELAYILNNATSDSLIILDEIGRGTGTLDGLSIAHSVVEKLTEKDNKIRTLFATHYHELTKLDSIDGVKNLSISIEENSGEISFNYKVQEHPADKSYGIQVARLAGVPQDVIDVAYKYLQELSSSKN